jgi:type IX secretion system PorP/SprF family membrane protein
MMRSVIQKYRSCCILVLGLCLSPVLYGQQYANSPVGQYFRNGYLWNPAYAGSNQQPSFYALHNNSWLGFEGAPTLDVIAGRFAFGKASGMGAKLMIDKSGILQRTTAILDYGYTMRFSDSKRLRLGVSGGLFSERLNPEAADLSDPSVYNYENSTVFDGNLGAVYENKGFSFGGVFYNLNNAFFKGNTTGRDVARTAWITSCEFLITPDDSTTLKPLLAYKTFTQTSGLFTAGVQLERNRVFHAAILWQSMGNVIGTIGLRIAKTVEFSCSYSSNNKYGYGQAYEIGLGVGFR